MNEHRPRASGDRTRRSGAVVDGCGGGLAEEAVLPVGFARLREIAGRVRRPPDRLRRVQIAGATDRHFLRHGAGRLVGSIARRRGSRLGVIELIRVIAPGVKGDADDTIGETAALAVRPDRRVIGRAVATSAEIEAAGTPERSDLCERVRAVRHEERDHVGAVAVVLIGVVGDVEAVCRGNLVVVEDVAVGVGGVARQAERTLAGSVRQRARRSARLRRGTSGDGQLARVGGGRQAGRERAVRRQQVLGPCCYLAAPEVIGEQHRPRSGCSGPPRRQHAGQQTSSSSDACSCDEQAQHEDGTKSPRAEWRTAALSRPRSQWTPAPHVLVVLAALGRCPRPEC